MSGKNITVDDKKINKSKKLFHIYDVDVNKILISKKEPYVKKTHSNTFMDIMMMSLDLYVSSFLKWLDMLNIW